MYPFNSGKTNPVRMHKQILHGSPLSNSSLLGSINRKSFSKNRNNPISISEPSVWSLTFDHELIGLLRDPLRLVLTFWTSGFYSHLRFHPLWALHLLRAPHLPFRNWFAILNRMRLALTWTVLHQLKRLNFKVQNGTYLNYTTKVLIYSRRLKDLERPPSWSCSRCWRYKEFLRK